MGFLAIPGLGRTLDLLQVWELTKQPEHGLSNQTKIQKLVEVRKRCRTELEVTKSPPCSETTWASPGMRQIQHVVAVWEFQRQILGVNPGGKSQGLGEAAGARSDCVTTHPLPWQGTAILSLLPYLFWETGESTARPCSHTGHAGPKSIREGWESRELLGAAGAVQGKSEQSGNRKYLLHLMAGITGVAAGAWMPRTERLCSQPVLPACSQPAPRLMDSAIKKGG